MQANMEQYAPHLTLSPPRLVLSLILICLFIAGCPARRYFSKSSGDLDTAATCNNCEAGSYCAGKAFHVPETALGSSLQFGMQSCPGLLRTKGPRSVKAQCGEYMTSLLTLMQISIRY